MSKSDQENVIDLCSSSDEDVAGAPVKRVACAPSAPTCVTACNDNDKGILGTFNPYQRKKKPRLESNIVTAASQLFQKKALLVFISGDGTDNAIVTDDLVPLLKDVPTATTIGFASDPMRMLHIQQRDKWSCGFRNLQMLLSSMLPLLPKSHSYYRQHSDSREEGYCSIPSVFELQEWMERSWEAGYDLKGAEHYQNKMVGSSKQIGAAEVSSLLNFCGMDNVVIQFAVCMESRSLLGSFCLSYFSKFQQNHLATCHCHDPFGEHSSRAWAHQLLSMPSTGEGACLCNCPLFPLYLQWEGHSVTIVGVETPVHGDSTRNIQNLLVFDPAMAGATLKKSLRMRNLQPLRFPLSKLKGKDCQLVLASMEPLSFAEQEQWKHCVCPVTAAPDAVQRALNRK